MGGHTTGFPKSLGAGAGRAFRYRSTFFLRDWNGEEGQTALRDCDGYRKAVGKTMAG